ncbi:hypothetical protein BJV78DRAFT_101544 [Lactifluus subvellereus]|nr:hypothetical protein BJV78DRAFT_101544 [Lactifluus subvellereus]
MVLVARIIITLCVERAATPRWAASDVKMLSWLISRGARRGGDEKKGGGRGRRKLPPLLLFHQLAESGGHPLTAIIKSKRGFFFFFKPLCAMIIIDGKMEMETGAAAAGTRVRVLYVHSVQSRLRYFGTDTTEPQAGFPSFSSPASRISLSLSFFFLSLEKIFLFTRFQKKKKTEREVSKGSELALSPELRFSVVITILIFFLVFISFSTLFYFLPFIIFIHFLRDFFSSPCF